MTLMVFARQDRYKRYSVLVAKPCNPWLDCICWAMDTELTARPSGVFYCRIAGVHLVAVGSIVTVTAAVIRLITMTLQGICVGGRGYRSRLNSTGSSSGSSSRSPSPNNRQPPPAAPVARSVTVVGPQSSGHSSTPNGTNPDFQAGGEQSASMVFGGLRRSENFGGASSNLVAAVNAAVNAAATSGSGPAFRDPLAAGAQSQGQVSTGEYVLGHMAADTNVRSIRRSTGGPIVPNR